MGHLAVTRLEEIAKELDWQAQHGIRRTNGVGHLSDPVRDNRPDSIKDELAQQEFTPWPEPAPWPELEPFGSVTLPPFPVECLSPWLRDWAVAEAEFTQTPVDMSAWLALAAVSLAASRGVSVEITPGFCETTNLWVVCALPPGERKSPPFEAATKPLFAFQTEAGKQLAGTIGDYEAQRQIIEGRIEATKAAAIKGKLYESGDPREAGSRLREELRELQCVSAPTLIADDVTPEAVARLLSLNHERLGVFSAEGDLFEIMAGRYSDGSNLGIWLKSHNGDSYSVSRIKRDPIVLAKPLTTIAITTQPVVVQALAKKDGFRGKGLLARFIYCLPESRVGTRVSSAPRVSDDTRALYGANLIALLTHLPNRQQRVALSTSADGARRAMQDALEPRLGPYGDLQTVADWAGKLVGLTARLAGVLHVADHAPRCHLPPGDGEDPYGCYGMPAEVPLHTWLRAQAIAEYALGHARHAFALMGASDVDTLAGRILKWLDRHPCAVMAPRDAARDLNATAEAIGAALAALVARGYLRRLPPGPPTGGRPTGPRFEVRPALDGSVGL